MKFPALIFWTWLDRVTAFAVMLAIALLPLVTLSRASAIGLMVLAAVHSCATYTHGLLRGLDNE